MKLAALLVLVSLAGIISTALADEKSDAILKEARLRAANLKTYSVAMESHDGKKVERIVVYLERPDKFRIEVPEEESVNVMLLNGDRGAVVQNGNLVPVPVPVIQKMIPEILALSMGNIQKLLGGALSTTYVTQKMLDETTVVDVIDVVGAKGKSLEKARLYIDNNGQIRKLQGVGNDRASYILFLNPTADEPIPAEKFTIPEKEE